MPKTAHRSDTPSRVDTRWFQAAITASSYGSMRALAPHLRNGQGRPMNHAALWLMIRGRRRMSVGDARQFADLVGKPFGEVCRRAGVDVADLGDDVEARLRTATKMVGALLAFIDEHGLRLPDRLRDAANRARA